MKTKYQINNGRLAWLQDPQVLGQKGSLVRDDSRLVTQACIYIYDYGLRDEDFLIMRPQRRTVEVGLQLRHGANHCVHIHLRQPLSVNVLDALEVITAMRFRCVDELGESVFLVMRCSLSHTLFCVSLHRTSHGIYSALTDLITLSY